MKKMIIDFIEKCPVKDMEWLLDAVAERINTEKEKNKDIIPLNLFPKTLQIYGAYHSVEIIVKIVDDKNRMVGYAFKKRKKNNHGYRGQYHFIGTTSRRHDTPQKIINRLSKEIWGNYNLKWNQLIAIGTQIRWEEYRQCTAFVSVFGLIMTKDEFRDLAGKWKIFPSEEIKGSPDIIDLHRGMISWKKKAKPGFL
jgi:hypothetical protein